MGQKKYKLIVMGGSAGGFMAYSEIFQSLPAEFGIPIVAVQHMSANSHGLTAKLLNEKCQIKVKEAEDKELIEPQHIYLAPPNYHLYVESKGQLSLSVDGKENHSRPSIDVLFESAADFYGSGLIGVLLTGSNSDGALGLKYIKEKGGLVLVQNPLTALSSTMPKAALEMVSADFILDLKDIPSFLLKMGQI